MRVKENPDYIHNFIIGIALATLAWVLIIAMSCSHSKQRAGSKSNTELREVAQDSIQNRSLYELNNAWSIGYEYYRKKNYHGAIRPFWKVIALDTINRFRDKYSFLADSYIKLNLLDSAQMVLEQGVKAYSQDIHLHRTLANVLELQGLIVDAIQEYRTITKLDSTRVGDWKALGNLYDLTNATDDAIKAFEKVISLAPKDQEAHQKLSRLYKTSGDADAALRQMEEVKRLNPTNTENLFNLGREYFYQNDFKNAIINFESLLKLKPDDPRALEFLGNSLQNQGNFRRAINIYHEIMKLQPNNKKILTDIATSYKELEQFATARSYAKQALEIDSGYGLAHIIIGEIYEAQAIKCYTARGKKLPEFDDKLVFDLAYQQYQSAAQDLQYKELAEQKMSNIKHFRPSKEDLFFHRGQTKPKDQRYDWIYQQ